MTLEEFNSKWSYKSDMEKYGISELWIEPKPDNNGNYESDCEDYAIFLKRNIAEFKDYDYCYCKLNEEGHCVLVSPGGMEVIDNNTKKVIHKDLYTKQYNVTDLRAYKWYELLGKFSRGYLYKVLGI